MLAVLAAVLPLAAAAVPLTAIAVMPIVVIGPAPLVSLVGGGASVLLPALPVLVVARRDPHESPRHRASRDEHPPAAVARGPVPAAVPPDPVVAVDEEHLLIAVGDDL